MTKPSEILLTVHGVGNPRAGDSLLEVTEVVEPIGEAPNEFKVRSIPGTNTYTCLELNWADIRRPLPTIVGLTNHLFALLFAMLDLAEKGFDGPTPKKQNRARLLKFVGELFPKLYRFVFLAFSIWGALLPLVVLVTATELDFLQKLLSYAPIVLVFILIFLNIPSHWRLISGAIWLTGLLGFAYWTVQDVTAATELSTNIYQFGQLVTVALLLLAFISILFRSGSIFTATRRKQRLSYAAFLYLPFVGASLLGSLLWGLTFFLFGTVLPDDEWAREFSSTLWYRLGVMEWALGVPLFVFGAFAAVAALHYRSVERQGNESGQLARKYLTVFLYMAPLALSISGAIFGAQLASPSATLAEGREIENIYKGGLTRLVPYFAFLAPGLRIVFDIIGDVGFYLVPEASNLSIRAEVRRRLRETVKHALKENPGINLRIIAQSQGTIPAVEEFVTGFGLQAQDPELQRVELATLACPLTTLYGEFLAWTPKEANAVLRQNLMWKNLYRSGDYIGGRIDASWNKTYAVENISIGSGGHTGYWRDPRVRRILGY